MNDTPTIDDCICERTFRAEGSGDARLVVRIGRPVATEEHFICPYLLLSGDESKSGYMAGFDSFQAIELALRVAYAELEAAERRLGLKLVITDPI